MLRNKLNFFRCLPLRAAYTISLLRVSMHPGVKARRSKIRLGTLLLSLSVVASCTSKSTDGKEKSDSIAPDTHQVFSCYDTIAPPPRDRSETMQKPANRNKTSDKRNQKITLKGELDKKMIDSVPGTICYAPLIDPNDGE